MWALFLALTHLVFIYWRCRARGKERIWEVVRGLYLCEVQCHAQSIEATTSKAKTRCRWTNKIEYKVYWFSIISLTYIADIFFFLLLLWLSAAQSRHILLKEYISASRYDCSINLRKSSCSHLSDIFMLSIARLNLTIDDDTQFPISRWMHGQKEAFIKRDANESRTWFVAAWENDINCSIVLAPLNEEKTRRNHHLISRFNLKKNQSPFKMSIIKRNFKIYEETTSATFSAMNLSSCQSQYSQKRRKKEVIKLNHVSRV